MAQKFYLIGGAPTSGKSFMAKKIAKYLGLPFISTDQLREIVKPYGDKARFPHLYQASLLTAEEFLTRYSPQEIAEMEYAQGADVLPAIRGIIKNDNDWERGCVIEGVNILPDLVGQLEPGPAKQISSVFLVDLDKARLRDIVFKRGVYGHAHEYSDDVKPVEVEWVHLFATMIEQKAKAHSMPVIHVSKKPEDFDRVLSALEENFNSDHHED